MGNSTVLISLNVLEVLVTVTYWHSYYMNCIKSFWVKEKTRKKKRKDKRAAAIVDAPSHRGLSWWKHHVSRLTGGAEENWTFFYNLQMLEGAPIINFKYIYKGWSTTGQLNKIFLSDHINLSQKQVKWLNPAIKCWIKILTLISIIFYFK